MSFPANDNRVRSTLSAADLSCPACFAGVGEACKDPLPCDYDGGGYWGHHRERGDALRDVGDASLARGILRGIYSRQKKRNDP